MRKTWPGWIHWEIPLNIGSICTVPCISSVPIMKGTQVASYWRIRTGINQSDTALSTEVNLALALEAYGADVDFETVWGQAHVEAERTGDSTTNFIAWVVECCQ